MGWFGPSDDCGCCNECCVVGWSEFDCRLYWGVGNCGTEDFSVHVTGPGGYDQTFTSGRFGMIGAPVTGTYTATYTDGERECTGSIAYVECAPEYPCCIRTTGIYGELSGVIEETRWNTQASPSRRSISITDHTAVNTAFYRAGVMTSGAKTDTTCYDGYGAVEDVLIGTGTEVLYYGIPYTMGDDTCAIPADDYYLTEIELNISLRFTLSLMRVIAEVTSVTTSSSGSPVGSTITPPSVTDVKEIVKADTVTSTYLMHGICGYESRLRARDTFLTGNTTYCDEPLRNQTRPVIYEGWPGFA